MRAASRQAISADLVGRVALASAVYASFAATNPNFRTEGSLFAILEGFAFVGLIGLGLSVTMIAGELDLSVGSVAAVAGITAVYMSEHGLVLAVIAATCCAMAFGVLQGFAIARLQISSLVFTLGTLIGLRGVAFIVAREETVSVAFANLGIADALAARYWIFSPFSLATLGAFVLVGGFLAYTRYGREVYAIGGGRNEARAAGVSMVRPIVVAFTISATTAGLAGSLAALKSGAATPDAFASALLDAATVALVGGISLYGGRGNVFRVVLGALTLRCLIAGLNSRGAPYYIESLATGALLLGVIAVEFSVGQERLRKKVGEMFAGKQSVVLE